MPTEDEPRLTRAEWEYRQRVEECTAQGHPPHHHIRTLGDPIGLWTCECGKVVWTGRETERG